MARFSGGSGSGSGAPGPRGPVGPQGDSAYEVAVANGFVGTEQEWLDSLGGGGNANIADFIFTNTGEFESTITLPGSKRMTIESGDSSDLYLIGGDDVYIVADDDLYLRTINEGDDIHLEASDDIRFTAGTENETSYSWRMNSEGELELPGNAEIHTIYTQVEGEERQRTSVVITTDGSAGGSELDQAKFIFGKNGAYFNAETNDNRFATMGDLNSLFSFSPLPDFLTFVEGRGALPVLNENFGWNSNGLWFGPTAVDNDSDASYPVFTNFTLNQTDKVFVRFNVDIEENCSDAGICVFPDGTVPNWTWGSDATRIAAQFNCPSMEIHGTTISTSGSQSVPANGTYRIEFTYDPTLEIDNVKFEYFALNSDVAIGSMTLSQVLPSGNYRIGFASDNDIDQNGEGGADSPLNRTYISDLYIDVNNGQTTYSSTLQNGNSGGTADIADFVFTYDSEDEESRMTIHNHDMRIQTTRDDTQDADIDINSADDIWMTANDDIEITSTNGEVRIYSNGEGGNGWAFRQDGMIGIEKTVTGIEVTNNDDIKGRLQFDTDNGQVILQAYSNNQTTSFTTSDWATATWTTIDPNQSEVTITTAPNIYNFMSNIGFGVDTLKIAVNGQNYGVYGGANSSGDNVTLYITNSIPGVEPVTVTDLSFQYAYSSKIDVNYDEGDFLLETQGGLDIRMESSEDIRALANDDIRFTTNWNSGGTQHEWTFGSDGILYGPAEGAVQFYGAYSPGAMGLISDGDMNIVSNGGAMRLEAAGGDMNFYMDGGMYIGPSESGNQIVKMEDLELVDNKTLPAGGEAGYVLTKIDSVDYNVAWADPLPTETVFSVNGGALGTQPTFDGAPLFTGSYVKHGPMVHFQIQVDMDNILTFGTGQYYVDLPFPAKYGYQVTQGCLHDVSTGKQYAIGGHVYAGQSRLNLNFTNTNGQDEPFDFNSPVTLATEDNFHIAGTYIAN